MTYLVLPLAASIKRISKEQDTLHLEVASEESAVAVHRISTDMEAQIRVNYSCLMEESEPPSAIDLMIYDPPDSGLKWREIFFFLKRLNRTCRTPMA